MITKAAVPVQVTNGIGELPCDLLRLLRAYGGNSSGARTGDAMEPTRLKSFGRYDKTNTHIKPSWLREGTIFIDYYAIPTVEVTDENGQSCQ
jgi:hypothetical protein